MELYFLHIMAVSVSKIYFLTLSIKSLVYLPPCLGGRGNWVVVRKISSIRQGFSLRVTSTLIKEITTTGFLSSCSYNGFKSKFYLF